MKKEQMVASRLPEELLRDLGMIERVEQSDPSTTVSRLSHRAIGEWKRDHFAHQYGEGKMTLARAAQEAGVSLWEMIDYVRQHKVAAQYDPEDPRRDAETIQADPDRRTQGRSVEVGAG